LPPGGGRTSSIRLILAIPVWAPGAEIYHGFTRVPETRK
jgi:hypothetical protein